MSYFILGRAVGCPIRIQVPVATNGDVPRTPRFVVFEGPPVKRVGTLVRVDQASQRAPTSMDDMAVPQEGKLGEDQAGRLARDEKSEGWIAPILESAERLPPRPGRIHEHAVRSEPNDVVPPVPLSFPEHRCVCRRYFVSTPSPRRRILATTQSESRIQTQARRSSCGARPICKVGEPLVESRPWLAVRLVRQQLTEPRLCQPG